MKKSVCRGADVGFSAMTSSQRLASIRSLAQTLTLRIVKLGLTC